MLLMWHRIFKQSVHLYFIYSFFTRSLILKGQNFDYILVMFY